jgi:hypothetical protein
MSRLQVLHVRPNEHVFYLTSHFVSCATHTTHHKERKVIVFPIKGLLYLIPVHYSLGQHCKILEMKRESKGLKAYCYEALRHTALGNDSREQHSRSHASQHKCVICQQRQQRIKHVSSE